VGETLLSQLEIQDEYGCECFLMKGKKESHLSIGVLGSFKIHFQTPVEKIKPYALS
jgi:hypothetical protein